MKSESIINGVSIHRNINSNTLEYCFKQQGCWNWSGYMSGYISCYI